MILGLLVVTQGGALGPCCCSPPDFHKHCCGRLIGSDFHQSGHSVHMCYSSLLLDTYHLTTGKGLVSHPLPEYLCPNSTTEVQCSLMTWGPRLIGMFTMS